MKDATLLSSEVLVAKPKRFVRELLRMPDGQEIEWYFADTTPSVMVVPVTENGDVVMVRQYRHNLKKDTLELPAGIVSADEPVADAALRELVEETGYVLTDGGTLHALGSYYALPSETNKYVNLFLATPVHFAGQAQGDTEIEKYFDMSTVHMPFSEALAQIGKQIDGLETAGALLLARNKLSSLAA
ncbi:NUDIX domain-containing protein [Rhizocola hellebori]|nr:NUDIX hydrolase [Rhizocola hellebori]